jgi:uncharacterized membrane protein
LILGLGFALHRPLSNVPENKLKFVVGVLLSAFGTLWVGEGIVLYCPRNLARQSLGKQGGTFPAGTLK